MLTSEKFLSMISLNLFFIIFTFMFLKQGLCFSPTHPLVLWFAIHFFSVKLLFASSFLLILEFLDLLLSFYYFAIENFWGFFFYFEYYWGFFFPFILMLAFLTTCAIISFNVHWTFLILGVTIGMADIEPKLATCKANALPTLLSLWPKIFSMIIG